MAFQITHRKPSLENLACHQTQLVFCRGFIFVEHKLLGFFYIYEQRSQYETIPVFDKYNHFHCSPLKQQRTRAIARSYSINDRSDIQFHANLSNVAHPICFRRTKLMIPFDTMKYALKSIEI